MAEYDKKIEVEINENSASFHLPPLATEATLKTLVDNNQKLKTNLDKYLLAVANHLGKENNAFDDLKKALEKTAKKVEDNNEELGESAEDATKALDNLALQTDINTKRSKENEKAQKDYADKIKKVSQYQAELSKTFIFGANVLDTFFKSLISIGTITGGYLVASVTNTGEALKSLTDVGQAFGDVTQTGTQSTLQTINAFNRMGLSVDQATSVLSNFSRAAAVLGQNRFADLNQQFLELTNYGKDFGITLDDATQIFSEDQEFRSRILSRDQLNDFRSAELSRQSLKNLRLFSTALGVSTDQIRQSSMGLVDSNPALQSLIQNLGSAGPEVEAAAKDIVAGLQGAGVDDSLIVGILETATTGAVGFNETLAQILPTATPVFNELTQLGLDIRNGRISQANADQRVSQILESFSTIDPGNLKSLVATLPGAMQGPVQALINSSQSAEIAAKNLANAQRIASEAGFDTVDQYSRVQEALAGIQNVLLRARGAASSFQVALVDGLTATSGFFFETKAMQGVMTKFNTIVGNIGRELGETIANFLNRLGGNRGVGAGLEKILDGVVAFGKKLNEFVKDVLDGFIDRTGNFDFLGGIVNYIGTSLGLLFSTLVPIAVSAFITFLGEVITHADVLFALITYFGILLAGKTLMMFVQSAMTTAMVSNIIAGNTAFWGTMTSVGVSGMATLMAKLNAMATGMGFTGGLGFGKGGLGRGLAIGGGLALGGTVVSGLGNAVADNMGRDNGSGGRWVDTGSDIAAGALYGAAIGSVVPVLGTGIGALVGGGLGLLKDMFLDDDGIASINKSGPAPAPTSAPVGTTPITNADGSVSYISVATPQPSKSSLRYDAIDRITDKAVTNQGEIVRSDRPTIERLSDEAQLLVTLLAEMKSHKPILKAISEKTV